MRRTAHRREKQQPNETGGFRFAVTLLAAFGTLSYAGYNYLQTTPVDPYRYWFVCRLIAVAVILVLGLLFYILIKGYSMEVHDDPDQKNLEKWASRFYRGVFLVFACLLAFITFALVLNFVFVSAYSGFRVCIVLTVVFAVVFSIVLVKTFLKKIQWWKILISVVFLASLFLLPTLFSEVLYSPLQGHVTVDMESIYYQNVSQIPVLIHVTGPNTGLSIYLVKKDSSDNLPLIENITLIPEQNPSYKTVSGKFLVGNTLDYGTYNVFINTTDLTVGYYELVCLRGRYETYGKKCFYFGKKGFYLLNSSQQSYIKE